VDAAQSPGQLLQETTVEGHIPTRWSQAERLHQELAPPLPGVIIATTPLHPQARAPVIRLSRDLALAYAPLVDSDG